MIYYHVEEKVSESIQKKSMELKKKCPETGTGREVDRPPLLISRVAGVLSIFILNL